MTAPGEEGDGMKRPGVDEHDAGSYLVPTLDVHDVQKREPGGEIYADGTPSYDYEQVNLAPELCREHAWELARTLGFEGPVMVPVTYQSGLPADYEQVLVKGEQIATYSYGRAYFEPGEPRTAPCEVCGTETLISAGDYE